MSGSGAFGEDHIGPLGILFTLLLVGACVWILDYGVLPPPFPERSRPPHNIHARLAYSYNDPEELNRQRDLAAEKSPRVYTEDVAWADNILQDLLELIAIAEVASSERDARERATRYPRDADLVVELYRYSQDMGPLRKSLSTVLAPRLRGSLQIIASNGILARGDLEYERAKGGERRDIVRVIPSVLAPAREGNAEGGHAKTEELVPVSRLRDVDGASDELRRVIWRESIKPALQNELFQYFSTRLTPNLRPDPALTEARQALARDAVGKHEVEIPRNALLLSKDRPILKTDLEKLHAEYAQYKRKLSWDAHAKHLLGLGAAVMAVMLTFLVTVRRGQPGIFRRRQALAMLGLLFVGCLAGTRLLLLAGASLVLAPFVFVGMVASLAFGQTVALLALLALCLLSTLAGVNWVAHEPAANVPTIGLALMAGGMAAALPLDRLSNRWDLLRYGLLGGLVQGALVAGLLWLGSGASYIGESLAGGAGAEALLTRWAGIPTPADALLALANGPLCGGILLGSLPLVESLFGVLTNIRLFELADMNQPLLKRIQLEAPGTFAHTLQVRFLAESAAAAINANTRLVSAGVLYHDVGKVVRPEYFIENQMDATERHKRLRPSVSAVLITAHVKDGMDLAKQYGLPQQIIDFIPEHHGTTLVSYFYHSARKNVEAAGGGDADKEVQESFFRYPGPRPRSRETAITMLEDTVEAASLTLSNPNAARLAAFTHERIMDKVLDGQLDDCPLTFKELALIEAAFVRVLVTRFHARIRYPGQEEPPLAGGATTIMETPPGGITPPPGQAPAAAPGSGREAMTETRLLGRRRDDQEAS
jgi:hypothetical protein